MIPDTGTKYVLDFNSGLNNAELRGILEKAKFHWQEIDVVNVTGQGTNTIEVHLDKLPSGRLWKVEITGPASADGAFRDEAGNTFEGWNTGSVHTFWSAQTATPVIRVERVSNNRSYLNQDKSLLAANIRNTDIPMPDLDDNPDAVFQTNVRYRIDCETPDAVIQSYVWNREDFGNNPNITSAGVNGALALNARRGQNRGAAIITNNMVDNAAGGAYRARRIFGAQSSFIPDATVTQLTTNITLTNYPGIGTIGDNSLYTARKDYIVAEATRSNLARSERGFEGAFKTLIIFRNFAGLATGDTSLFRNALAGAGNNNMNSGINYAFLRLEAANTDGGAVTVAGFPMKYNDMSGGSTKNFYRNPNAIDGVAANVDWIWISWEIVSDFWHVPMVDIDPRPYAQLRSSRDAAPYNFGSWDSTSEDWQVYSYRAYGNWGLRVYHRP
jgi:hypothetical protein